MTELINAFFAWGVTSPYAQYFTLLAFIGYFLSHTLPYFPATVTEKIPNWIMVALNVIGAKHGADKSAKTDIKGNLK